jgi:hypothetical protein
VRTSESLTFTGWKQPVDGGRITLCKIQSRVLYGQENETQHLMRTNLIIVGQDERSRNPSMFFKKKVPLKEFCHQKFDFILSDEARTMADQFRNRCGTDFTAHVDQEKYLAHFRGAFLEFLGVVFSRTLNRDQRYDVMFIEKEYLKTKGYTELDYLHRLYNSAFGSSPVDGVEQMAICLTEHLQIQGVDTATVMRVHHDGFYRILKDLFSEIKKIKLV